jgi:hypothetical protein
MGEQTLSFVALPVLIFVSLRSLVGTLRVPRDRGLYGRVVTYGGKISGLNAVDSVTTESHCSRSRRSPRTLGIFSIAIAALQALLIAPQALALSAFRRIGVSSPELSAALTDRAEAIRSCSNSRGV